MLDSEVAIGLNESIWQDCTNGNKEGSECYKECKEFSSDLMKSSPKYGENKIKCRCSYDGMSYSRSVYDDTDIFENGCVWVAENIYQTNALYELNKKADLGTKFWSRTKFHKIP